ncbi:MAG: hypothetical protein IJD30_02620, partial [Clostridia bacterium]|nr:hypothetical protein [Clostridia bacterium]
KYVLQRSNYDYSELDVDLYVNGVLIEGTRENIENYVLRCETGNIKLVDTYKTDGYYDTIHVNYYVTGKVMGVIASTGKIYIENAPSSIILDPENEDLVYSIYLDGEEITVDDLREGDVLTIAYDISGYFVDSFFYEIYVSRDTVSGVLTEKNPGEEWVKIDGEKYMFADVYEDELTVGDEYTLYLDCFGRIYDWEIVAGSVKYAVLNKFIYSVSEDSYVATLYTDEGQEKTCVFDGDVVDENGDTITGTDAENYIIDAVYNDDYSRTDVLDRIIEYKISAAGELKKVQFVTPYVSSLYDDGSMETYSERNARIGGVKLSSNTKIINAAEYVDGNYDIGDLEVCTIKNLIDDEAYAAYAYGSKCSDGTYPFVVITMGNITGTQESDDEENDDAVPDDGETDTAEPERAIIDRFIYSDSAEGYKATLYTTDGVAKLYVFDGRVVDENNTEVYRNAEAEEYILNAVYQNGNAQNGKTSVVDRVVEYNINTETGKISTIKFLPVCIDSMDWQTGTFGSYDKNTSTIGSIKLDRSTVIFDAVIYVAEGYNSYSDLGIASADDLVEGTQYEAFAFGEASSDGAYPLVIVTSAVINYNAETSFAVVTGALTHTEDVYGNFVYGVPVLYEGEATDLWVSHDAEGDDVTSLNRGDVIFFMTNNEGYVDQIDVIFSFGDEPAYSDLTATLVEDNDMKIIDNGIVRYPVDDSGCMPPDFAKEWYTTQFDAIQLVFGPVMEKGDSYFTLGSIAYDDEYGLITNKYNDIRNGAGGCYEIDYTQDTNIYVYDYAQTRKDARLYAGGSIVATRFADAYNANGGDTILWDYVGDFGECVNKSSVNFAFAKVVDGEATDVFAFLAK